MPNSRKIFLIPKLGTRYIQEQYQILYFSMFVDIYFTCCGLQAQVHLFCGVNAKHSQWHPFDRKVRFLIGFYKEPYVLQISNNVYII